MNEWENYRILPETLSPVPGVWPLQLLMIDNQFHYSIKCNSYDLTEFRIESKKIESKKFESKMSSFTYAYLGPWTRMVCENSINNDNYHQDSRCIQFWTALNV